MTIRTIGFPGRYLQGPGAVAQLGPLLSELGSARPVVIADDIVRAAAGDAVSNSLQAAGLQATTLRFAGECTRAAIAGLALDTERANADLVIGLGGGKTIDTAKGVARARKLPLVIVPSIASNDSPTSRLIVLYDEQHAVAGVDLMLRNPDAVVVDTTIIARAPLRFFVAGLGDALSKKYEANQCHLAGGKNFFGTPSLPTARLLAGECHATIFAYGRQAVEQLRAHAAPDEAVERCVEAAVLLSGLGFESGGLSLAHALTRGFTAHPVMRDYLHGELVGFGTIVQLFAEECDPTTIEEHSRFSRALGLPTAFMDFGVAQMSDAELEDIAVKTCAAPYIGNLRPAADAARIVECLKKADALGRRLR